MTDTNAQTVSYVRETMLPEQAPPLAEKGAIGDVQVIKFKAQAKAVRKSAPAPFEG